MKSLRLILLVALLISVGLGSFWLSSAGGSLSAFEFVSNKLMGNGEVDPVRLEHPSSRAAADYPKEPISLNGKTMEEILCLVGEPQVIETSDPWAWIFYFKGSFVGSTKSEGVTRYAEVMLNSLTQYELERPLVFYRDEMALLGNPVAALPEELKRLYVDALPEHENHLVSRWGGWSVEHGRGRNKKRVVYDRPVCLGGQPYKGMAVSIDSQRITGGKAIPTYERLARAVFDLRTYSEESADYSVSDYYSEYGSEPVARDGAVDAFLSYIVSREFREYEKSERFLVDNIDDADVRFELTSATDYHETIDVATLQYKISEVFEERVAIDARYQLTNGLLVGGRYTLFRQESGWRIGGYTGVALEQIHRQDKLISDIPRPDGPIFVPEQIDEVSTRYVDRKPIKNSPQEALIHFLLHREKGEAELAEEYISNEVQKWEKRSLLRRCSLDYGAIDIASLNYQMEEIENGVYRVNYSVKWENGTYTSGRSGLVIENGRWKII